MYNEVCTKIQLEIYLIVCNKTKIQDETRLYYSTKNLNAIHKHIKYTINRQLSMQLNKIQNKCKIKYTIKYIIKYIIKYTIKYIQ